MERIRLTQRMAARNRQADSAEPETAIDLGKNRTYHEIDEYHTFEPSLNHWEPDMRHEWKEDKHDETGFGVPKMAKVYMAAKKATKLAMMLLGENANEASLEAQARAFMRMGDRALTASIDRWATCQGENCGETKNECGFMADDEETAEAPAKETAEAPAKETAEVPPTVEAPAKETAEVPKETAKVPVEEAPVQPSPKVTTDDTDEDVDDDEDEDEEDVQVSNELADTNVKFDDPDDNADVGPDEQLESIFDGEEGEEPAPVNPTASKKSGLKKLAGQPTLTRVASKNADDLAGIWDKWENPDVR